MRVSGSGFRLTVVGEWRAWWFIRYTVLSHVSAMIAIARVKVEILTRLGVQGSGFRDTVKQ